MSTTRCELYAGPYDGLTVEVSPGTPTLRMPLPLAQVRAWRELHDTEVRALVALYLRTDAHRFDYLGQEAL